MRHVFPYMQDRRDRILGACIFVAGCVASIGFAVSLVLAVTR